MTKSDIRETVKTMRLSDDDRAILLARALAGEPGAVLVVQSAWKLGAYRSLSEDIKAGGYRSAQIPRSGERCGACGMPLDDTHLGCNRPWASS